MRIFNLPRDEKANISMDFLTAVAVIIIAFVFAASVLSSMITPYSGYSKELYPTADRAVTLLVEDEGYWESDIDEGTDWETEWNDNYSNVKKIGFLESKETNTLDSGKIEIIMKNKGTWWEYSIYSPSNPELDNASRAMGLGRYNFYIQIRPLDESKFNVTAANQCAIDMVGDRGDVATVVRYSVLNENRFGYFDGSKLKGLVSPTRPIFGVDYENFSEIRSDHGLRFFIFNWTIDEGNVGVIKSINIGDEQDIQGDDIKNAISLKVSEFNIEKNYNPITFEDPNSNNIGLDVEEPSDIITFFIPISTFNYHLPDWDNEGNLLLIQVEVGFMRVNETGTTWYNMSSSGDTYPVKSTLWVW
jgi:hypothetical protein